MFAVISDIHSNLEALTTVLADIEKRGIKTIYCLGDVVGYGPNPIECLDLIINKTKWCVMGNHDYAVFYEPTNFNYAAEQASFWTRQVLETEVGSQKTEVRGQKTEVRPQTSDLKPPTSDSDRRWNFLGTLPMRRTLKTKLHTNAAVIDFVHASPKRPINEYIFPDDVYSNPIKIRILFERLKHICFVGHTHLPGVFLDEPDFYLPEELGDCYPIVDNEKAIINIGSVGQPRDGDRRSSYVYADENEVYFVRLEYDFETTVKKIMDIEQLDNFHAERLRDGR
jgi:predicted phosphodiesterase